MSTDKDYLSLPINEFLADVAARTPTPGGGSVAAMTGALAAALGCMVVEYSLGKKELAAHERPLRELLEELTRAREEFGRLVGEDTAAYRGLASARKSNATALNAALARAVAVPMEMVSLAGAVVAKLDDIKSCVNPALVSDLRVAAVLANACARSAALTVQVNLEAMTDPKKASRLEDRIDLLMGRITRHRNAVVHYQTV